MKPPPRIMPIPPRRQKAAPIKSRIARIVTPTGLPIRIPPLNVALLPRILLTIGRSPAEKFLSGTKQEQSASTAGHLSANSMNGQESDFWSEPSPGNLLPSERELFCPSICPAGCQKIGKETIFPTCVNEIANLPRGKANAVSAPWVAECLRH